MKRKPYTLWDVRNDASGATLYAVEYRFPASPANYNLSFDKIGVNLSASQYIALKGDGGSMTIALIREVTRRAQKDGSILYRLKCADYTGSDTGELVTIKLTIFHERSAAHA